MPQILRNKLSAVKLPSLSTKISNPNLGRRLSPVTSVARRLSPVTNSRYSSTMDSQIEHRRALDPQGPTFDAIRDDGFFFRPSDTVCAKTMPSIPSPDYGSDVTVDSPNIAASASISDTGIDTDTEPQMTEPVPTRHRQVRMRDALHSHPPTPPTRSQGTMQISPEVPLTSSLGGVPLPNELEYSRKRLPSLPHITSHAHAQASRSLESLSHEEIDALCGAAVQARIKRSMMGGRVTGPSLSTIEAADADDEVVETAQVKEAVTVRIVGVGPVSKVLVTR